MNCSSCGKELKYSGDEGAHLWQIVHLLNHLTGEVHDLVDAFSERPAGIAKDLHDLVDALGDREQGDPGWVLHYIENHLREIAEGR